MANVFQSLQTREDAIREITMLLEEHAAAREAATLAHNEQLTVDCWYCTQPVKLNDAAYVIGEGSTETFPLHRACLDGCQQAIAEVPRGFEDRPIHGYISSSPGLTPQDIQRLGTITKLANGPHKKAILAVVKRYMPGLFAKAGES